MAVAPKGNWHRVSTQNNWHTQKINWLIHEEGRTNPSDLFVTLSHGNDGEPIIEIERDNETLRITDVASFLRETREKLTTHEPESVVLDSAALTTANGMVKLQFLADGTITWKGTI